MEVEGVVMRAGLDTGYCLHRDYLRAIVLQGFRFPSLLADLCVLSTPPHQEVL